MTKKGKTGSKKKAKKKKTKKAIGRPQKVEFTDNLLMLIQHLVAKGETATKISEILGISRDTFYKYKKVNEAFADVLENGKDIASEMVEQALFSRALGHSHKETKVFYDSKEGRIVTHQVDKIYAPDTQSAIFWLKNKKANEWRDRMENQTSVEFLEPVIIEDDEGRTKTLTMKEPE